ncbi:hypothetical protein HWX41_27130 [Bacillus paramycoides]|uniref:hypothetical protein n=1 Tax=Bacillus paramycoides TaxID=2026194 RepID=UPI0015C0CC0D|nr:hypothetical protein [Bacillus paramycoides]NWK72597.1 hypothetical protein [Bacillus paramycoides]
MTYTVIAELEGETFKLVTGASRHEVKSHIAEFLLYDEEAGKFGTFKIIPEEKN